MFLLAIKPFFLTSWFLPFICNLIGCWMHKHKFIILNSPNFNFELFLPLVITDFFSNYQEFCQSYKLLSFLFGLTYMGDILRDDRLGQKPTLEFSEKFCISTPGGVRAFVYVFIFWPFWRPAPPFFLLFWVQNDPWLKTQHIYKNWDGVFPLTHFISQNVNKLLRF